MSSYDEIEFEVGKPILYMGRQYVIVDVKNERTIRVAVGELDLGCKDILKNCMKENPDNYTFCIARWFIIQKKLTHMMYKTVRTADPEKHQKFIEELIRLDELEPMDVVDILHYALTDEFWKDNCLTLSSLRVRSGSNKLMKWENIRRSLTNDRKWEK